MLCVYLPKLLTVVEYDMFLAPQGVCNTKDSTSYTRNPNFEFNKTLWSGGKHSGFISWRSEVHMLIWKLLIFTYTFLDSCRRLC